MRLIALCFICIGLAGQAIGRASTVAVQDKATRALTGSGNPMIGTSFLPDFEKRGKIKTRKTGNQEGIAAEVGTQPVP